MIKAQEAASDATKKEMKKMRVTKTDSNPYINEITLDQYEEITSCFNELQKDNCGYVKFHDLELAFQKLGIEAHPYEFQEIEDRICS